MIKMSGNGFDADAIMQNMINAAHEKMAQAAADGAIEQGVSSVAEAEALKFDLKSDSPEVDLEKVERLAREILVRRLS
ncbi:hypothetical protein [Leucobacter luti]|uniref:Uncharacterized protein n=1 Tax=Leucobacter luti TaxID=340320 RepID=A0A4Q7U3J0_9MICO|nr:hypothetical protein [Leucobacter luti]MBL3699250.1 hypothetical protein [Leucobacter luti]RZT66752.1 hypothetical protein EV139_0879 [Leucobacter luti]